MKLLMSWLALILLLSGCSGGEEAIQAWIKEAGQHAQAKVPPLPPVKPYQPVPYEVRLLPDPFSESKIEPTGKSLGGAGAGMQPDFQARERRNSPLEKVSLDTLRMIGYLVINREPIALIQSDQMVKQVRVGDYMGLEFGIVTGINEQELTLKELAQDSNGNWVEKNSTLPLIQQESQK